MRHNNTHEMGATGSAPLANARVTLPTNVRLESVRNQLEALEEACAHESPELDWRDLDKSVLLHSACNALRNETAVLEHNMRSAEPRWRRQLCAPLGSTHKSAHHTAGVKGSKAMKAAPTANVRVRAGRTTSFTVAFSEAVALIDAGSIHIFSDDVDAIKHTIVPFNSASASKNYCCDEDEGIITVVHEAMLDSQNNIQYVESAESFAPGPASAFSKPSRCPSEHSINWPRSRTVEPSCENSQDRHKLNACDQASMIPRPPSQDSSSSSSSSSVQLGKNWREHLRDRHTVAIMCE